jgi:TolB-like protein
MKISLRTFLAVALALNAALSSRALSAGEAPVYTSAIFAFQDRGVGVRGHGERVVDLLYAALSTSDQLLLVDRVEIEKALQEQELGLAGMADPATAARVGKLAGAQILLTGSVIQDDTSLLLVGKLIGSETTRALAVSVKGRMTDPLSGLVDELAEKIRSTVAERGAELVPPPDRREDIIRTLAEKVGDQPKPTLFIRIPETHLSSAAPDPAAETEFIALARASGFEVVSERSADADVIIEGEAFSELALRRGNLVSCKARVELRAIDNAHNRVIQTDREVSVAVDVAEFTAAKTALQRAAASIAVRLLPEVARASKP